MQINFYLGLPTSNKPVLAQAINGHWIASRLLEDSREKAAKSREIFFQDNNYTSTYN
jgi:hypothetical protein